MNATKFLESVKSLFKQKGNPSADLLQADTLLIESGIVDSILLTELIIFVEDYFDIIIDVDAFNIKSFSSVNTIVEHYATQEMNRAAEPT